MKVTTFKPTSDLIIVEARIWAPNGRSRDLLLALDTASSETLVTPDVVDALGYSARHGEAITVVRTALDREQGFILRVARFAALHFEVPNFRVHVHDLPEGFGIQGLLGLSFLRQFNYEVRSREGRLLVDLA